MILNGDCRETLKTIADGSVHCCVTSPPYWGLRSYLPVGHPDKHMEIGQEPTPEAWVETMVGVFREVKRCLHDSATVWLNVGDSYASAWPCSSANGRPVGAGSLPNGKREARPSRLPQGLKEKDLCLIPWRLAIALQADGWWVRSVIAWAKKSCMPESVTDRPTNSWEPIFLLAKSAKYFYDAAAVKERAESDRPDMRMKGVRTGLAYVQQGKMPSNSVVNSDKPVIRSTEIDTEGVDTGTRNQRNVWALGPSPYPDAHFATFPSEVPKRAILAGTSAKGCCPECKEPWVRVVESTKTFESGSGRAGNRPNGKQDLSASETNSTPDIRMGPVVSTRTLTWKPGCNHGLEPEPCTVLDPFLGSGTVAQVAQDLGRRWIGCELSGDYHKLINNRTAQAGLEF